MPRVNPDILTWARETAGLSLEEAATEVKIKNARGRTNADRLASLERGEDEPSRPLLLKMAKKYRRPLLAFYLDKIPPKGDRGQDFRTAPEAGLPAYDEKVDALIRDIKTRHSLVKSLLEDEEALTLPFISSVDIDQDAESVAKAIRKTLCLKLDEFRNESTVNKSFKYLRSRIESAGIFVLLIGNLGSHHTNILPEIFRGFAIADPIAPFVVINDQDAHTAWSFTALHEAVHLWLGKTGISSASTEVSIETFCNDVARRILLPGDEIQMLSGVGDAPFEKVIDRISSFADERKLSRSMVAYCLLRATLVSDQQWQKLQGHFHQEWVNHKDRNRVKQQRYKGGQSYYSVTGYKLGASLLNLVDRSLSEGAISYSKASKVLGVKPRSVAPLLSTVNQRGGV